MMSTRIILLKDLMSRRSATVWGAFIFTMTAVGGLLLLTDPGPAPQLTAGRAAMSFTIDPRPATILDTQVPVDRQRWQWVVIHDSGSLHGSVESAARAAQNRGLKGIADHFMIGNGNGMGDGDLHVSYRWNEQLPGGFITGSDAAARNSRSIGICLIGNSSIQSFTDQQIERLVALVVGIQKELNIPLDHVILSPELLGNTVSRSRAASHFPVEKFREQLRIAGSRG